MRVLLDEICTTYGSDPTIARAETFRTGGVLGFFQREHYRLVIDEEAVPAEAVTESAERPVISLVEEPAAGPAKKKAGGSLSAIGLSGQLAAEEITAAEYFDQLGSEPSPLAPRAAGELDPFASIADEMVDQTYVARLSAPALAHPLPEMVELPSFEEVLRRVATMVDAPEAAPVVWPRVDKDATPARPAAHFAPGAGPDVSSAPAAGGTAGSLATPRGRSRILDALADLEALTEPGALVASAPAIPAPAPPAGAAPTVAGQTATTETTATETTATTDRTGATQLDATATAAATDTTAAPAGAATATTTLDTTAPRPADEAGRQLVRQLIGAGLDPAAATAVGHAVAAGASLESALMAAMAKLPAPERAPRRPGSLIVVVGAGRQAGDEAVRMAAEVGADPAEVVFATDRRPVWSTPEELLVRSAGEAAALAPNVRDGQVAIVAVDAPNGSKSATILWARRVIDAFDPTFVVAVADAMHKSEDVADWIEGLGGVDALVLDHADTTASPARLTELGVPVSRIGDQPATPARWAATVVDRVADTTIDVHYCPPAPVVEAVA